MPDTINCGCEDVTPSRTLAELRVNLLRRLGYSAQAANPPPGMTELLNSFLDTAHRLAYRTYPAIRTERFFSWTMIEGERFYGLREHDDPTVDETDDACDLLFLDPQKVTWVGIEDLNGTWYPLLEGIPPEAYTRASTTTGWPSHYEIRGCIEVFPAPQAAYTLHIKGRYGLLPFAADTDKPSVDDEVVFLLALAQAKRHYGQPDANDYYQQALTHIQDLVAGSHHTRRYVPGERRAPNITPPRFLPLEE